MCNRMRRGGLMGVPVLGEVDQREVYTFVLSPQLCQQRLGLLQVGRVKALGEPAVD